MPTGVALTTPCAPASASSRSRATPTRPGPKRAASRLDAGGRGVHVGVEHVDARGSLAQQAVADGHAGTPRADQQHPVVDRVGQHLAEGAAVPGPVGVAAEHQAVAEDDRVHRTQVARVVGEVVEQRHHRLLERVGDVHPVEAEPAQPGEHLRQVGARHAVDVEVDEPVGQREPGLASLALLHGRGQRGADPGADQAERERRLAPTPGRSCLARDAGAHGDPRSGADLAGRDLVRAPSVR